jgi:hypothetical protein
VQIFCPSITIVTDYLEERDGFIFRAKQLKNCAWGSSNLRSVLVLEDADNMMYRNVCNIYRSSQRNIPDDVSLCGVVLIAMSRVETLTSYIRLTTGIRVTWNTKYRRSIKPRNDK